MPGQLRGVEIMAVGSWSGSGGATKFEVGDLEDIVSSFRSLNQVAGFRPHLKLGHTEAQAFFGQRSGFPSLGEVTQVWRDGTKVFADFSNVPDALVDLIVKRRYNAVSVELYPKYTHEGTDYRNVLVGVALLGAELPAVKGLRDLADALYKEVPAVFSDANGKVEYTQMTTKIDETPEAKAAREALEATRAAAAETQRVAFEAQEARIKSLETLLANQTAAAATAAQAALLTAFTADVDRAISEGRLLPKAKDAVIAFATSVAPVSTVIKFGEGDAAVEKTGIALFSDIINGLAKVIEFGEKGQGGEVSNPEGEKGKRASEIVDERAQALVSEKKADSYATAVGVVLTADADLKARYIAGK